MIRDIAQALVCLNLTAIVACVTAHGYLNQALFKIAPTVFAVIIAADLIARYAEWFR